MATDDQRKNPRIQSSNLLSYVSCDETDQEIMQGMGRTLNVSEGGILLETHVPIDQHHVVTLTIALEEELMAFKGRVAHATKLKDGGFLSGIEFTEMDEKKRQFFRQYVLFFRGQETA